MHWCKLRLRRQGQPSHSWEQPTSPGQTRAHQISAAALYILQHRAYDRYYLRESEDAEDMPEFEDWCHQREDIPQFQYRTTMLELELLVLVYEHSLRQVIFTMYLDVLTELAPWFHALDRTNYARWIPVHLRDMADIPTKHSYVTSKFRAGSFTVQKTKKVFSVIAIEQNNACRSVALDGYRTRSGQGHRRVPTWGRALGKVSRHTSSRPVTKFSYLIRQRCPFPCQRDRRACHPF